MTSESIEIINSLKNANPLVGDLPEAKKFDRNLLGNVDTDIVLNFEQKLGHLYEDALGALIKSSPDLGLIKTHLQIFDEQKRTIGELDFVLLDKIKNQYIHLELAVKFYLGIKTSNGWKFPGPDQRDNWQRKLKRLQNHQLLLTDRYETKECLQGEFNINEIKPQQLIYGCLFSPINVDLMPLPEGVSDLGRRGQWLYTHQWNDYFNDIDEVFLIPKHLWPVEINQVTRSLFKSIGAEDLKKLAKDRCVMFCLEKGINSYFLVPNEWGE